MSYVAQVLTVMIASPSDLPEARDAVRDAIYAWNESNSRNKAVMIQPWRWETSAVPITGDRAQSLINSQGVDRSDIVFALFGSRLGSPTSEAVSGTAEEIERAVGIGKPVHVYFSDAPLPRDVDVEQLTALRQFKKAMQEKSLLGQFSSPSELHHEVWKAIEHDLVVLNLSDPDKNRLKEPTADQTQKDLILLDDRMNGWELGGDFHSRLRNAFHKRLPREFVEQLEKQVERWEGDTREFHNPEIAEVWSTCKAAAELYVQKINFYMSYEDDTDYAYLQVPLEWRDGSDHGKKYRDTFDELESARSALLESVGAIYKTQHSKSPTFPGSLRPPN